MKVLFVVVALVLVALVAAEPMYTQQRLHAIRKEARFEVGASAFFAGKTEAQVRRLMGVKDDGVRLPQRPLFAGGDLALPASFSWTDKGVVGAVRNQGDCGSCWVFGGVEALSDRMRIAGRNVNASATDPMACDDGFFSGNNGCHGGSPAALWDYLARKGAVDTECAPYLTSEGGPIPTCPPEKQPCLNFVPTPACNRTCVTSRSWEASKIKAKNAYSVSSEPQQIMAEIFHNGPVEGAFTVYSDFPAYKSGVYERSPSATPVGGHAIEIVGWGTESGKDYWYVRNSWTTTWGDKGYFKILRGQNECGIEGGIVAGMPDV